MQPGDLITVRLHPVEGREWGEVLLWDQAPDGRPFVRGQAVRGEFLLFLGWGMRNTVRVLHPLHGVCLIHRHYLRPV
jgi:hypothetical protein